MVQKIVLPQYLKHEQSMKKDLANVVNLFANIMSFALSDLNSGDVDAAKKVLKDALDQLHIDHDKLNNSMLG